LAELEAKIEFSESEHLYEFNSMLLIFHHYLFNLDIKSDILSLYNQIQVAVEDSILYERIRNGFQVLIFGPPNSGKSSLMNCLGK
jgi:tRNA U34 5-carboxymethylaminomethyl modifying GTPase MnmE/TrmE